MASIALGIAGCGSDYPAISNLVIQPAFIPAAELEQTVSLSVTFSFNASQADVAIVHVRSSLLTADQPIDNPTGATTGRGEQVFAVTIPAAAGAYPLEVWMTDGAGHDSNKLYGAVTVAGGGSGK